jgi:hypothetical protein
MTFLTNEDLYTAIDKDVFNMLIEKVPTRLEDSEATARGYISGNLGSRYNLQNEFAKSGGARNATLVRWMIYLTVYYLYNTVQDLDIPERVTKNYDDVRKEIEKIVAGKMATDLTPITGEDGKPKTIFHWGSSQKRTHNPYGYN